MIDSCKHITEKNCLLRKLAEGSAEGIEACQRCDATLAELELQPSLVKRVADGADQSVAAHTGMQRAGQLVLGLFNADNDSASSPRRSRGLGVRCPSCGDLTDIANNSTINNFDCLTCGEPIRIIDTSATQDRTNQLIGHFRLVEQVGAGSFGVVWKAEDTQLNRTVAVKIPRREQLSPSEVESFLNEARASAALKHPNIVAVHEIGRENDSVYIVSDFVEGQTLEALLKERILAPREAATMSKSIAEALHHAHEKAVVHRDLKPGNIAVDDSLQPTIMDFGLALRTSTEMSMTSEGKILGTPAYMSPEQARGESNSADRRSDVHSLGVILFEMLTGERPFRGNIRMLLNQIMYDEPVSPQKLNGSVPRDLATICLKCLEKSPDRRYQTGHEVTEELQRFLDGRPIAARPVSAIERGWRWCRRNPLPAALATLLFASMAIGTGVSVWNWREASAAATAERVSAKRANDVLAVVTKSFESANPEEGAKADMSAKDILFRAQEILKKSKLDPLGKADVLSSLNRCFLGVGEYDSAIAVAEQELAIRDNESDILSRIVAKKRLAEALRRAGKLNRALVTAEETHALAVEHLPKSHKTRNDTKFELAQSLSDSGSQDRAIELHQEVYAYEQQQDSNSLQSYTSANALAACYQIAGRSQEALELLEPAYQRVRIALGEDDAMTLSVLNNLAEVYESVNQVDKAISTNERLLELRKVRLGKDHPDTIATMNNLAFAYQSADRLPKAIQLFEATLKSSQDKLGETHPKTMTLVNNLAMTYWRAKRLDKSIPMFEQVVKHLEDTMGRDHLYTQTTLANLGVNYRDDEQYDRAITYLKETHRNSFENPQLEWTTEALRIVYTRTRQLEAFREIMKAELDRTHSKYADDSPESLEVQSSICRDLVELKLFEEAESMIKEAMANGESLGPEHWHTCHLTHLLGVIRLSTDKYDEAELLLKRGYLGMKAQAKDMPSYNRRKFLLGGAEKLVAWAEATESDTLEQWQSELDSL